MLCFSFFSPIIILSCTLNGAEMPRRGTLQNGIVLNMQMKQENNLGLFFNPLRKMPFFILHSARYPCPRYHPLLICTLEAFSFQYLPFPAPTPLLHHPHVCPHLLRSTQIHGNRNSKINFKDISKVQMEKS